jgi:hypothetical protein
MSMECTKIISSGGSLVFRIPLAYRNAHGLKRGDQFLWRDDGDGYFTLKAVRQEDVRTIFGGNNDQKAEANLNS